MNYDFKDHKKGDTFPGVVFTITVNGGPLNLTGAAIKMELRKLTPTGELGGTYSIGSGFTLIDAPNGNFGFDKQVIDIDAALYYHDVQIILANGDKKSYIEGTWNIRQDVTQDDIVA